jgi:hypothetical protein
MSEHQVVDLLDRATSELRVDPDLVRGAVAAGRRRRRRHLVGTAAATVAVLTLVGGTAPLLRGGGTDSSVQVTDPGPTKPTTAPEPVASAREFGPAPAATAQLLGSLLHGTVTQPRNWGDHPGDQDGFQAGSVLLDGAQVTILLEHTTLPRCGEQPPDSACDSVGNGLVSSATYDEPAPGGGTTGVRTSTATLYTADHLAITATAYNAPSEKGSDPILEQPVLGQAALTELVQDPAWLATAR